MGKGAYICGGKHLQLSIFQTLFYMSFKKKRPSQDTPTPYCPTWRYLTMVLVGIVGLMCSTHLLHAQQTPDPATEALFKQMDSTAWNIPIEVKNPFVIKENSAKFLGRLVRVEGTVMQVKKVGKSCFLDLVAKFPDNPFTVVVYEEDWAKFPDLTTFKDQKVEVVGMIEAYKYGKNVGRLYMKLRNADQVKVKS